jgi:hypothetical protein
MLGEIYKLSEKKDMTKDIADNIKKDIDSA